MELGRLTARRLAAVLLATSGLCACGWTGDPSLTAAVRAGVIRVGYAVVPPYALVAPGAKVTGESPEVARVVAARLGIPRIEWIQTEFGSLIDGLTAGRFAVVAAGMFITAERASQVSFSDPSFHATDGLLVRRGNPRGLHGHEDAIGKSGTRLVVLAGSTEEQLLRSLGMPADQLLTAPDALSALRAVEQGAADGLPLSTPAIRWMMMNGQLGATEMAAPFRESRARLARRMGYGGFVFRKADRRLRDAWNRELRAFVGSPAHRALVEPFGITDANLPGAVTVEELLGEP